MQDNIDDIIAKHEYLLSLIRYSKDINDKTASFAAATKDSINQGFLTDGSKKPVQNNMCVDDNMIASIPRDIKKVLAASIEALFILLGRPEEKLHESPLSMD